MFSTKESLNLGPEFRRVTKRERKEIAKTLLQKVGLLEYKDKYTYQLSGGIAQLVAICRVLAYQPSRLLFNEPFSSLDYIMSHWKWKKSCLIFGKKTEKLQFLFLTMLMKPLHCSMRTLRIEPK